MSKEMKSRYCKDIKNIENYEKAKADKFIGWVIHHRLETHNSDGERRTVDITQSELKALGMYWHRPASELIFLPEIEHNSLHHKGKQSPNKGKKLSKEHKRKMSESKKGRHWFNNGKEEKFCYECPEGFVPGHKQKKGE